MTFTQILLYFHRGVKMNSIVRQIKVLSRGLKESFAPRAPGSPLKVSGRPFILCHPPTNLARSSPIAPFAQKFRVLYYILSEHKFLFSWVRSYATYPIFVSILTSYFNRNNLPRLSDYLYRRVWFFYWFILLLFWYNKTLREVLR